MGLVMTTTGCVIDRVVVDDHSGVACGIGAGKCLGHGGGDDDGAHLDVADTGDILALSDD